MRLIVASFLLNLFLVIIFGFIYWKYNDQFSKENFGDVLIKGDWLDYFYLSVTIQAGVGYKGLTPITNIGKILLMIQQMTMITTNIIVMYMVHLQIFS